MVSTDSDLKIESREVQEVTVLKVSGRMVDGIAFGEALKQCTSSGRLKILVDLSGVTYMTYGLYALARGFVAVREQGGQLKLLCPSQPVRQLLELSRLERAFEIYDNEQEALHSFASDPAG